MLVSERNEKFHEQNCAARSLGYRHEDGSEVIKTTLLQSNFFAIFMCRSLKSLALLFRAAGFSLIMFKYDVR
jgi:hypothetical protein